MKKEKIVAASNVLKRDFHFDLFSSDEPPQFMILYFGGSGVDHEEYDRRSQTINPTFETSLQRLERELNFFFCCISSPPDINIESLKRHDPENQKWLRHLQTEFLSLIPKLPFYFIGYSGGLALATSGLHLFPQCFGGGALGGDGISRNMEKNLSWSEPLTLYYNLSDPVYHANDDIIQDLTDESLVLCFRRLPGTHNIRDYITNESFSGLIRRAGRLASRLSEEMSV